MKNSFSLVLFLFLAACSSKKNDEICLNQLVQDWNKAHILKDEAIFSNIFDSTVYFYGMQLDRISCIKKKLSLFKKYPKFSQQVGDIELHYINDSEVKCSFIKSVTINNTTTDYLSYLICKKNNDSWKIISEGDLVTDANLAKRNKISPVKNVFDKEGNIFVQYENDKIKQIVSDGDNTFIAYSKARNIVVYTRVIQESKVFEEEVYGCDQLAVYCFDLLTNQNKIIFTTSLDGEGGTIPDYANSSIYPFSVVNGFSSGIFSNDGERLYFETYAWVVSSAVHYYSFKENKLVFFKAGSLIKVSKEGITVETSHIDWDNGGGRIFEVCLFDKNGGLIKVISTLR